MVSKAKDNMSYYLKTTNCRCKTVAILLSEQNLKGYSLGNLPFAVASRTISLESVSAVALSVVLREDPVKNGASYNDF